MSDRIETVILSNLVANEDYARKVLPFLQSEYFHERPDQLVYGLIHGYFSKYNTLPSKTALTIDADSLSIPQGEADAVQEIIHDFDGPSKETEWLLTNTEKFCKDQSVYNAIMQSIQILEGKDKTRSTDSLPSLLQEAISVSFDKSVGHDYMGDVDARYDFYHQKESKVPFELSMFNKITKGGVWKKTLNCVLAATNVGKSLFLCDQAAAAVRQGLNALYITMEMAEERISERIDCNLLDIEIDELSRLSKREFISRVSDVYKKSNGNLIVKEYPTGSAHAGHFRILLDELKQKKNFVPDVIFIDYMNICASQRLKNNGTHNSYTVIKSVAEELRALAVEQDVPIWTATQTNRGGANNSEISITDVSESFGVPMTLDFFFAMVRTEELDNMGQIMIIQLKSRYGDANYYKKFVIGVDIKKFKLYDTEMSAHTDLSGPKPPSTEHKPNQSRPRPKAKEGFDFDFG